MLLKQDIDLLPAQYFKYIKMVDIWKIFPELAICGALEHEREEYMRGTTHPGSDQPNRYCIMPEWFWRRDFPSGEKMVRSSEQMDGGKKDPFSGLLPSKAVRNWEYRKTHN